MSLRAKLLISYVALLAVVLTSVVMTVWSGGRWREAAADLSRTNVQSIAAERLRWDIARLTQANRDMLAGRQPAYLEFREVASRVERLIADLRAGAADGPEAALELDHITGFEEAYRELLWLSDQVRTLTTSSATATDTARWSARLIDIDDEVADAATVLDQYLRHRNARHLAAAERAGNVSAIITGTAAAGTAVLVLMMIALLHRWVTRPVAELERAAAAIGAGDLDVRLPYHAEREWRTVAKALRHMTHSLSLLQQQLRTNERLTALGEVAAYVAHNIRNPLASIRAIAQASLIEREDAADTEALRDIIQCADKIESWVARLLGFARPLTLMPEPCDINAIVEEMISLHEARAAERKITFRCLPDRELPELAVDRAIFEQALAAIISNSLEATPPSGTITLTTGTHPADSTAEWVVIRVQDTGAGIPARLLPDVFKPFVTGRAEGNGLGLAQAKKIIDLHLGRIDIESVEGHGTTVTIQLPVPRK